MTQECLGEKVCFIEYHFHVESKSPFLKQIAPGRLSQRPGAPLHAFGEFAQVQARVHSQLELGRHGVRLREASWARGASVLYQELCGDPRPQALPPPRRGASLSCVCPQSAGGAAGSGFLVTRSSPGPSAHPSALVRGRRRRKGSRAFVLNPPSLRPEQALWTLSIAAEASLRHGPSWPVGASVGEWT